MKRFVDAHLAQWKESNSRKPLLVRGARQVGKTHAIRTLGKSFEDFIEINFEMSNDVALVFEKDLVPDRIIRDLSLFTGRAITPGKTLLFFDEIQAAPRAVLALRYFYELLPSLHVIAAGSLLDFSLDELGIPVGRVTSMYMYPMSFLEFLSALDQELLVQEILTHTAEAPLSEPVHHKLLALLGEYLAVGGMPEVVLCWQTTKDFFACAALQQSLVDTYRQDFNKYAKNFQIKYLNLLFDHIPLRLGKKFKYSDAGGQYQKRELAPCLELLFTAGVATKVSWTAGNGIPLGAQADADDFKVVFLDVALCQVILGLDLGAWIRNPLDQFVNKGELVEAFVGQELLVYAHPFKKPSLFYWHRTARGSEAEVDYLVQIKEDVVPLEVKSGAGSTLKSMQSFLESHPASGMGVRFSTLNYSVWQKIHSYPLYAVAKVVGGGC